MSLQIGIHDLWKELLLNGIVQQLLTDLSMPHFDEEATLLSARPVVPLHEVQVETGSRGRVIFALTIVAAILVGAISATYWFIWAECAWSGGTEVNQPAAHPLALRAAQPPNRPTQSVARAPADEPNGGSAERPRSREKKAADGTLSASPMKTIISRKLCKTPV